MASRGYTGRLLTSGIRKLPDFNIIGVHKSATTSLYSFITNHPDVRPARTKEVKYFSGRYSLGSLWYRSNFPVSIGRHITGEADINAMFSLEAPSRAAAVLPDLKMIVILRNPVDRAHSHYQHQMRARKREVICSFEEALAAEEYVWSDRNPRLYQDDDPENVRIYSYRARGRYADQLTNWFRHYTKEQFLVISTEELQTNTIGTMGRVFGFLGLDLFYQKTYSNLNTGGSYEPMKDDTRSNLAEYFRPHNAKLYELLGRDFGWES